MPTDFVDRVEYMAELLALVQGLTEAQGRVVVLEGRSGMGKSALLGEFARQIGGDPGLSELCQVASTRCYPQIGSGLTYAPAVDLLLQLHEQSEQRGWLRRVLRGAGRGAAKSAPEVLSAIVPGLGVAWTAGREVAKAALDSGSVPLDSVMPIQQGTAVRIADALLDLARMGRPVVLLVDDVQNIDPSSLMILDRLVHKLADEPIALVLSHAHGTEEPNGPAAGVAALLDRWEVEGLAVRRSLTGLPADAVEELVRLRHPGAPRGLSAELSRLTGGHSVFVSLCLEEWRPDNGTQIVLPSSVSRVVEARIRPLDERDRRLIAVGAVQGAMFLSRVVAETLEQPHDEVMERLSRIAAEHQLITVQEPPAWARFEQSDCYAFEHRALWQVLYEQQTAELRRSRHARIARALADQPADEAALGRRLEIAHHLDQGGLPCLEASADAHYDLARTAALDGLSFVEAESHCEVAIRAARSLPAQTPERDRRLVSAIELLLSLTEVRWRGQAQPAGGPDVDGLAAEAELAAARYGDPKLIARTALLRGKSLLATQGLMPSLVKLREAIEKAELADDPVAVFVAKVEYGRQVSKRRLSEGLEQLREVERMYAADPALGAAGDPVLQHARNLAEMQLAISLYDTGHLTEALTRLLRCVERLRSEPLHAELPIALNYLAQVQTAMGAWTPAERTLREAIEFEDKRGGDSGWRAYNTALLAQLFTRQPARRHDSLELIQQAWLETERTWLANLVPIVRNLYADLLLDLANGDSEQLRRADKLALDTYVETGQTGMVRSQIAALTLRSRTHLLLGDHIAARALAEEALRILDEVGDMPALRTEEVLFHAARAMHATGDEPTAQELLERARTAIIRKADHIDDVEQRRDFLQEVPLNRWILEDGERS
ncbi:AAA family ATPase [Kitasatospora sp. NBC_01287]|uniref:AAA family ATPase n=1 Tax=Kitasatospora sp. NBC_01287 TaxID=2903573 RepID=UPI00225A536E|nr:AAA family ATPase [Kitasatospora sp. NBC_01287]MCX4748102.1 AAA family ATPase [Kitasatospora sp. NBC_01287]